MTRRKAITAALAALALTASAACSSGGADRDSAGANPTVATDPPTTTTTNPYAVPAVIDVAYVNRVLAGLDAAVGDVVRLVVSSRTIPREAYDRLKAIYLDPRPMQLAIDAFQLDMRRGFVGYRPVPGNKRSSVTEIVSANSTCIFVRIERDYSAVSANPPATLDTQWIGLKPLDPARDPKAFNPTPWSIIYEGFPPDRSQPADPCAD